MLEIFPRALQEGTGIILLAPDSCSSADLQTTYPRFLPSTYPYPFLRLFFAFAFFIFFIFNLPIQNPRKGRFLIGFSS